MRTNGCSYIALLALALCLSVGTWAATSAKDALKEDLLGCWQRVDNKPEEKSSTLLMRFEEKRFINVPHDGPRQVLPITYKQGKIVLGPEGAREEFKAQIVDGKLTITNPDNSQELYKKLTAVPEQLDISPLNLGDIAKKLEPAKVEEIKKELAKRVVEDQAVRKETNRRSDMGKVDAENTAWLRKLVQETGWIDCARFDRQTASQAFLIVQHSGDLRLMQAALPLIQKDMKSGAGDPQDYALLYDRVKNYLGEKQRYGSQIGSDQNGNPVVLPLEDRGRVEEFRKEIGLFPLSDYLAMMKKMTGKDVKFADDQKAGAAKPQAGEP